MSILGQPPSTFDGKEIKEQHPVQCLFEGYK